jgi:hypothetical protein
MSVFCEQALLKSVCLLREWFLWALISAFLFIRKMHLEIHSDPNQPQTQGLRGGHLILFIRSGETHLAHKALIFCMSYARKEFQAGNLGLLEFRSKIKKAGIPRLLYSFITLFFFHPENACAIGRRSSNRRFWSFAKPGLPFSSVPPYL